MPESFLQAAIDAGGHKGGSASAPRVGDQLSDEIIRRLPLTAYLGARPGDKVACPQCDRPGDDQLCLHVYGGDRGWYCFGHDDGGSIIDYVMLAERLDHGDAIRKLGVDLGIITTPTPTLIEVPSSGGTQGERPATSWRPVDLTDAIAGEVEPAVADVLVRTDGAGLFYRGRYNLLFGASESCKTWVALLAEAQVLANGGRVAHVDLESEQSEYVMRMRLLGVTDDQLLHQVAYIYPHQALARVLGAPAADTDLDLADALQPRPDLIVFDAMGELMDLHGLSISDNDDLPRLTRFLRRLAEGTGAAVVVIDHIPKSTEGGSSGPIGAQAKRSAVTGTSIACRASKPLAPGHVGTVVLRIDKDRAGSVRAASPPGDKAVAARITLDAATATGRILTTVDPPREAGEASDALLARMGDVARALAELNDGNGLSKTKLRDAVGGKHDLTDDAIGRLRQEGHVDIRDGARGALVHVLVRPYPATTEGGSDAL